jgi:hypothetical protein
MVSVTESQGEKKPLRRVLVRFFYVISPFGGLNPSKPSLRQYFVYYFGAFHAGQLGVEPLKFDAERIVLNT